MGYPVVRPSHQALSSFYSLHESALNYIFERQKINSNSCAFHNQVSLTALLVIPASCSGLASLMASFDLPRMGSDS